MSSDHDDRPHALSAALILSALGVVYGDIGTSPLYAFKESIGGERGAGVSQASVLGVLSMIFWAITLVVSIKYVMIVLRAEMTAKAASSRCSLWCCGSCRPRAGTPARRSRSGSSARRCSMATA